jgi:hypothetical protein
MSESLTDLIDEEAFGSDVPDVALELAAGKNTGKSEIPLPLHFAQDWIPALREKLLARETAKPPVVLKPTALPCGLRRCRP